MAIIIGEHEKVKAPQVSASAKGGIGRVKKDENTCEFAPPDGWVMMDYSEVETQHDGDAYITATITQSEKIEHNIESIKEDVKGKAEGILIGKYGKGNFEGELNKVYETIESSSIRPDMLRYTAKAVGHPSGERNNTSSVSGYYNVDCMYIGTNENDIINAVDTLKQ